MNKENESIPFSSRRTVELWDSIAHQNKQTFRLIPVFSGGEIRVSGLEAFFSGSNNGHVSFLQVPRHFSSFRQIIFFSDLSEFGFQISSNTLLAFAASF